MNREIKFRAWKLPVNSDFYDWNKMYSWEVLQDDRNYWLNSDYFGKDFELMQFTGLTDKNGKEIYEGDIIKMNKKLFEMRWSNIMVMFQLKELSDNPEKIGFGFDTSKMEIIGNIYENQELLN